MPDTATRFVQAFLTLTLVITLAKLSVDTGGGDYFFTLIWLVLVATAAPYWLALTLMRRVGTGWRDAIGAAAIAFGIIDAGVRTQAFFFPTERSGGAMAVWLPIYSLAIIPAVTVIARTFLNVFGRKVDTT
jgi:hypothetical protein